MNISFKIKTFLKEIFIILCPDNSKHWRKMKDSIILDAVIEIKKLIESAISEGGVPLQGGQM